MLAVCKKASNLQFTDTVFEMVTATVLYRKEETPDGKIHISEDFMLLVLSIFLFFLFPWKRVIACKRRTDC